MSGNVAYLIKNKHYLFHSKHFLLHLWIISNKSMRIFWPIDDQL